MGFPDTVKELRDKIKERLRDKARDRLCVNLSAIGVDARMAESGRPEESVGGGFHDKSLGLIEIRREPIRWVNVLRRRERAPSSYGGGYTVYSNVYIIPDPAVYTMGYPDLESTRIKSARLFGRVVDIRWKSTLRNDLVTRMNQDVLLNQSLIRLNEDIEIISWPEEECWAISSSRCRIAWPRWWVSCSAPPSREEWDCYKIIARHLLEPVEREEPYRKD